MSASAPGWYEDPQNPAALRFFDGEKWTELVTDIPPSGDIPLSLKEASEQLMADKTEGYQGQNQQFDTTGHVGGPTAQASLGFLEQNSLDPVANYPGMVNTDLGRKSQGKKRTSGAVWVVVVVAALGIAGAAAYSGVSAKNDPSKNVVTTGPDGEPTAQSIELSADYKKSDVPSGIGCKDLGKDAVELSKDLDLEGEQLVKVSDAVMTSDYRDVFQFPVFDMTNGRHDFEVAFVCSAQGEFDDGHVKKIDLELLIGSDKEIYVYSTPR